MASIHELSPVSTPRSRRRFPGLEPLELWIGLPQSGSARWNWGRPQGWKQPNCPAKDGRLQGSAERIRHFLVVFLEHDWMIFPEILGITIRIDFHIFQGWNHQPVLNGGFYPISTISRDASLLLPEGNNRLWIRKSSKRIPKQAVFDDSACVWTIPWLQ